MTLPSRLEHVFGITKIPSILYFLALAHLTLLYDMLGSDGHLSLQMFPTYSNSQLR